MRLRRKSILEMRREPGENHIPLSAMLHLALGQREVRARVVRYVHRHHRALGDASVVQRLRPSLLLYALRDAEDGAVTEPLMKDGSLICEPWLAWVRRLVCFFCGESSPSQAHHAPPRGRGITDDSKTCAVCVRCHQRCHGNRVEGKHPISESEQEAAVAFTRSLFMAQATDTEWSAYCAARKRHRESRVFVEVEY